MAVRAAAEQRVVCKRENLVRHVAALEHVLQVVPEAALCGQHLEKP